MGQERYIPNSSLADPSHVHPHTHLHLPLRGQLDDGRPIHLPEQHPARPWGGRSSLATLRKGQLCPLGEYTLKQDVCHVLGKNTSSSSSSFSSFFLLFLCQWTRCGPMGSQNCDLGYPLAFQIIRPQTAPSFIPAARIYWAPRPGALSTLLTRVPTGKAPRGCASPSRGATKREFHQHQNTCSLPAHAHPVTISHLPFGQCGQSSG